MKNKVNISRIAKDMGMSASTVSRALSGNGRVSEETRREVLDYLVDKQLVPNTRERHYTDTTTNMIAVTVPEEGSFVFMPYFQRVWTESHHPLHVLLPLFSNKICYLHLS